MREYVPDTEQPDTRTSIDQDKIYKSSLLGLLAVAYCLPQLRVSWPKKIGLRGLERKQEMGAAQLPVLALMKRAGLLNCSLVAAMEALDS